jgi:hypothetical protein
MLGAAIASLLTQRSYIKHDTPKNLLAKNMKNEAVTSFKALFIPSNSSEPEVVLEYLEKHCYIEKEKFSMFTVIKSPKYKNVTTTLIKNMFLLGIGGSFAFEWVVK